MQTVESVLRVLEDESTEIFRETAAAFPKPVMLYSIGKDSSVLLHLARKAFAPSPIPIPLMHINNRWKFRGAISFREEASKEGEFELRVQTNQQGICNKVKPFSAGASEYTRIMKTVALRAGLGSHGLNAAIGGSRRDKEGSRAKDCIFSRHEQSQRWNAGTFRPKIWRAHNPKPEHKQSMKIPPIHGGTEPDVRNFNLKKTLRVGRLTLAKEQSIVWGGNPILTLDNFHEPPKDCEIPEMRNIRPLWYYPLTAGIESDVTTKEQVVKQVTGLKGSERATWLIDGEKEDSMDKKKTEGYF